MVRFPMPKTGWKRQGVARWLPVAKFTISKRAAGMKKILLVEDNPGDADLARLAFETAEIDCEIRLAESGEKALEIATEFANSASAWAPDLVLLDLKLPMMTGHEVLRRLKEDETLRRIPVIALSSSAAAEDIELSYDLSVNGYIQKPINMAGFVEVAKSIADFWLTMAKLPDLAR